MLIDIEEFFLLTLIDLRKRIENETLYDAIRACGLCRQLIVDGPHSLAIKANKEHKIKLSFEINDTNNSNFRLNENSISWVTIEPVLITSIDVNLEKLLSTNCLNYYNHLYSVRDIISAASNFMGGIHAGVPKDEKQKALLAIDEASKANKKLTQISFIAICRVVLDGLKPLEETIKNRHTPTE
jgi:hypothetical protein